jgi:hypothetical protein
MSTPIINQPYRQRRGADYHVYMVRVWSEPEAGEDAIRLTAEDARTGQRIGFTDWDKLVQHLQSQTKTGSS